MNDWYQVTVDDLQRYGGKGLLSFYYGSSPSRALQSIYPNHSWMPWKFHDIPKGCWDDIGNQRSFLDWMAMGKEDPI